VEYLPRHGRCISAGEAASVALALLTSIHTPRWPAAGPGLTLHDEVSRLLRTAGMSAQEKNVRYDDGDIYPEVVVTNPAAPGRGFVRVIEASLVRWEFRFAVPGRCGLTPAEVADAVAAALVTARTDGVTQAGWVAS